MKDLAYTPPKEDRDKSVAQTPDGESGPQYPSLRFNGEQAAKAGLAKCEFGEEYEMKVRVKATSIGGMSYPGSGNSKDKPAVEFDVLACDEPKEVDTPKEEAAEGEDEAYEKPKTKIERGPKEAGLL